eukprot:15361054-Ditylum_brightwellii.AAC.1
MIDAITRFGDSNAAVKVKIGKIFGLICGQYMTSMQALLKVQDEYKNRKEDNNVSWLINHLRQITSGVDNKSDEIDNYIQALSEWTQLHQN